MWVEYKLSADESGVKAAAYTTFCSLWQKLIPQVMVMKPMSEPCWICQKNSMAIQRAANTPESDMTDVKLTHHCTKHDLPFKLLDRYSKLPKSMFVEPQTRGLTTGTRSTRQRMPYKPHSPSTASFVNACLPTSSHMHFSFDMAQVWETSIVYLTEIDMTCIAVALSKITPIVFAKMEVPCWEVSITTRWHFL